MATPNAWANPLKDAPSVDHTRMICYDIFGHPSQNTSSAQYCFSICLSTKVMGEHSRE